MTLFHLSNGSQPDRNPIDAVVDRLPSKPTRSAWGYMANCPAHNDRTPSLSIRMGRDGRVLIKCWAGCSTESVIDALGLSWRDLFSNDSRGGWSADAR